MLYPNHVLAPCTCFMYTIGVPRPFEGEESESCKSAYQALYCPGGLVDMCLQRYDLNVSSGEDVVGPRGY